MASVLDSSDRRRYIESRELIRELDHDVLVPWAATAGEAHHALTDAHRRIDAILERVAAAATTDDPLSAGAEFAYLWGSAVSAECGV